MVERVEHQGSPEGYRSSLIERFDRYLRDGNTVVARLTRGVCPAKGEEYLKSGWKRALDLGVAFPAAVMATPVIFALGLAAKIEDGGPMFFTQERLKSDGGTFKILKIRSMREGSDIGGQSLDIARGRRASEDPRSTGVGAFMRRYQLDELPQFYQIVLGQLSLIGIRPVPQYLLDYLQDNGLWSRERLGKWQESYEDGALGLSGLGPIFGSQVKKDEAKYHLEVFYTENASLGLDLYLLWKTLAWISGL